MSKKSIYHDKKEFGNKDETNKTNCKTEKTNMFVAL